jgi:hypothetical protein
MNNRVPGYLLLMNINVQRCYQHLEKYVESVVYDDYLIHDSELPGSFVVYEVVVLVRTGYS